MKQHFSIFLFVLAWPGLLLAQPVYRSTTRFPAAQAQADPAVSLTFKVNGAVVNSQQQVRPVGDLFANYAVTLGPVRLQRVDANATTAGSAQQKAPPPAPRQAARLREEQRLQRILDAPPPSREAANVLFRQRELQIRKTADSLTAATKNVGDASRTASNSKPQRRATKSSTEAEKMYSTKIDAARQQRESAFAVVSQDSINRLLVRAALEDLPRSVWLTPGDVPLDQTHFDAFTTAHQLLLKLRQDALQYDDLGHTQRAKRRALGFDSRWAQLLFPHGSVWPWRWHWPWRKYNRFGNRRERQTVVAFDRELARQLTAQWTPGPASSVATGATNRSAGAIGAAMAPITPANAANANGLPLAAKAGWLYLEANSSKGLHLRLMSYDNRSLLATMPVPTGSSSATLANPLANALADLAINSKQYKTNQKVSLERLLKSPEDASAFVSIKQDASAFVSINLAANEDYQNTAEQLVQQEKTLDLLVGKRTALDKKLKASKDQKETLKRERTTLQENIVDVLSDAKLLRGEIARYGDNYRNKIYDELKTFSRLDFEKALAEAQQRVQSALVEGQIDRADLEVKVGALLQRAAPTAPVTAAVGENGDLIYHGQLLLPTTPTRRVAHLYVRDRGAGVTAQQKARYVVCLQYSATSGSYQDNTTVSTACVTPVGYLGISAELAELERTALVEALTDGLMRKDTLLAKLAREISLSNPAQAALHRAQILGFGTPAAGTPAAGAPAAGAPAAGAPAAGAPAASAPAAGAPAAGAPAAGAPAAGAPAAGAPAATIESSLLANRTKEQIKEVLRDFYDNYLRATDKLSATPYAGMVLLGKQIPVYRWLDAEKPGIRQSRAVRRAEVPRAARRAEMEPTAGAKWEGGMYKGQADARVHNMSEQPQPEYLLVDSVQVEVEDGNIMSLKAHGSYRGLRLLFDSYTPIGLSSDSELKKWYNQRLFAQSSEKKGFERDTGTVGRYNRLQEEFGLYVYLDDLMRYYPLLSPRAGDRSPADNVYTFRPQDALDKRILRRTPTAKILQARVYSDLVGLSGNRPNGLVQAEISKRIILNGYFNRSRNTPLAWAHYVCPLVAFNKIEANNSRLLLNNSGPGTDRTVQTIDLLRYTNLRVGLAMNVLTMRVPRIKSDFSLDLATYLNRVAIRDSLPRAPRVDSTVNVATFGPQLTWRVRPDSRWGFQAKFGIMREKLINNKGDGAGRGIGRITQLPQAGDVDATTVAGDILRGFSVQNIFQYELLFWTDTSENSQLFFRAQFSHLPYLHSRSFLQLQVGYQFDVFTSRRAAVMPAGLFSQ